MKQQIVQISNIEFTEPIRIKKLKDATQTFIYEDMQRRNPTMSEDELIKASHIGFILAQLHHSYECTYDIETITPNDVRYQEAADEIASYVETNWFVDDADMMQSADVEVLDETYDFEYQHTLYMYFDDWIQFGYEAYLGVADWDAAFHHIIYEYMRRFLTIELI
jgi:hypothetical protein